MQLSWLDADNPDARDVAGAVALLAAAGAVDAPHEPVPTVASYTAHLRHGWDGDPPHTAVARDSNGRVIAVLEVDLPHWDNTHLGWISVTVDPLARRRGIGREVFEAGLQKVRESGRRLVVSGGYDSPATVNFLAAMGLQLAAEDVYRRQELSGVDWARLDAEYARAAERAKDYEVVRLPWPTPDHLISDVLKITAAINDRPFEDLDVEDEVFTPERIRAFERGQVAAGRRLYHVAARHRDSGVLAGHTVVAVEAEQPGYAYQYDTSVLPEHRGHRLGLLLKIAMLYWLREAEPQIRTLDTDNAASNSYMIEVNEALGYRVIARAVEWQKHL